MMVRLGYVSISRILEDIISFHNITYTEYSKDNDVKKIDKVIKENFETLINILKYNCRNNIYFYRLTSKLIPLATHKNINIDYINNYRKLYNQAAILMKNMRVDVHPEQFVVLNSTKKDFRSHSEYINCFEFIGFIEAIKDYNTDIDIMLEAKGKDEAIFRLTRQLKFMTDY